MIFESEKCFNLVTFLILFNRGKDPEQPVATAKPLGLKVLRKYSAPEIEHFTDP